jgi:hypothetical protein
MIFKIWINQKWLILTNWFKSIIKYIIDKNKSKQLDAFDRLVVKIKSDSIKLPFAEVNDSLKYIVDIETNRIIWVDEGLENMVGNDKIGRLCYEVLQGCTHPCNFCTNHKLIKEGQVIQWTHYNKNHNKTYLVRDFLKIMDGRKLRYEMAIDITNQLNQLNKK